MSAITTRPTVSTTPARSVVDHALDRASTFLNAHSITILRISLGLVFLTFASFKFVSGASPAEELAVATVGKLTARYDFNDMAIPFGVSFFVRTVERFLDAKA